MTTERYAYEHVGARVPGIGLMMHAVFGAVPGLVDGRLV